MPLMEMGAQVVLRPPNGASADNERVGWCYGVAHRSRRFRILIGISSSIETRARLFHAHLQVWNVFSAGLR
jgi:hypothetical protein